MSRVQYKPTTLASAPNAGSSKSGTDWMLVSSLSITFSLVIFVLCSVIMPRAMNRAKFARISAAEHDLHVLAAAVRNFRLDCDRYPYPDEGLGVLIRRPINSHGWNGPYVTKIPLDPWHHPYILESPGPSGAGFEVKSIGPGVPSGAQSPAPEIVVDEDDR